MRIISLDMDAEYEIVNLQKEEFDSCICSILGGPYRMIYGDEDILLDSALMICDREDYMSCRRNPVASSFNLTDRYDRYIYGTAVLAKLSKGERNYEMVDFTDREISLLRNKISIVKGLFD